MKLRNKIGLWGVIMLFFCFTGSSTAAEKAGRVSISPVVGKYFFDDDQNLQDNPLIGFGIGYNYSEKWGVETRFSYIDSSAEVTTTGVPDDVKAYLYHLDTLYHFIAGKPVTPYLTAGVGGITFDSEAFENDTKLILNYGAGLKFYLFENMAIRAEARQIFSFDDNHNNTLVSVGTTVLFGDPEKPMPVAVVKTDTDGDGVYDDNDACPGTPSGANVDSSGCPVDSDNDGVFDYMDKCPHTISDAIVDSSGCPVDSDGDGVADYMDKCMNTPPDTTVDELGCPLDSDSDGVVDDMDQCPNTPTGAEVDEKGCWTMRIIKGLRFASAKSVISENSKKILDSVVAILKNNPNLKLDIKGYTDSSGSKALNMRLSQNRADAVKSYFIKKGIAADRLSAKGYGPEKPIAPNDSKAGRALNRRVELVPIQ